MGFIPSLPEQTNLSDVIKAFSKGWPEMLAFHDAVLRSDSPLSIAERELIAAYVSGLNECRFCVNAHTVYAEAFGVPSELFEPLMADVATAPVDESMRPVLSYARVLTLEPHEVRHEHVQAILDAGWPEQAVADACLVIALYNFMNRVISGLGVDPFDELYAQRRDSVRRSPLEKRRDANRSALDTSTYSDYGRQLGIID
jgi:uncharacterized peroxidase-related enzyme